MSKKIITGLIAVMLLLGSSLLILESYGKIQKAAEAMAEDSANDLPNFVANNLNIETSVYALKNRIQNGGSSPSENILTIEGTPLFIESAREVFDSSYYYYWNQQVDQDPNFFYYAIDSESKQSTTNHEALKDFENAELRHNYRFFLVVRFDENGNVITEDSSNTRDWRYFFNVSMRDRIKSYIERDALYNYERYLNQEVQIDDENSDLNEAFVKENLMEDRSYADNNHVEINPIRNMTYVFAIPQELEAGGDIYYYAYNVNDAYYESFTGMYAGGIALFIFIISLFLPIGVVQEWNWFKFFSRIKFEILTCVSGLIFTFLALINVRLVMVVMRGELLEFVNYLQLTNFYNPINIVINMGCWIVFFGLVMFASMMIRYIFHKGFIRYVKEDTLLFWFIGSLRKIAQWFMKIIDKILNFDFKDPIHQVVLRVVFINFMVITILCCFFVFGWFVAILYSVVIFFVLKKKLKQYQEDYFILLNAARQLANGDFNVTIKQDLGPLNSLSEAFVDLKAGFEKAVSEEVKSQRMKTELISNVSHDLKTPLTSIITYVDLLKKEEITNQERMEYINTIDRNSQRLKNLIEDLFEISKANSGNVSLHLMEVDIVALYHQVEFECQEKIQAANLEFKTSFNQDKILMMLDSQKTYRIFENLIINICKYALSQTRVYVDIMALDNEVIITLKNISANQITVEVEEITERFVQGDRSRNTEGSGLGLAIVKSFTQLQNGSFHVEVDGDLFKAILRFKK